MLRLLRSVLSTIRSNFNRDLFLRRPATNETPDSILEILKAPTNRDLAERSLRDFAFFCRTHGDSRPNSVTL
jgi:chromate reductase, NAD(P)H dehydrogenase (quinone)